MATRTRSDYSKRLSSSSQSFPPSPHSLHNSICPRIQPHARDPLHRGKIITRYLLKTYKNSHCANPPRFGQNSPVFKTLCIESLLYISNTQYVTNSALCKSTLADCCIGSINLFNPEIHESRAKWPATSAGVPGGLR